ncbi:MAG TPA: heavy-metal-associated domain-containing protein [Flavobacteriaceae bacterium]|nr:cation transporter [Flavobacteriaceae bacterium]HPF10885.1 heavy-metal-associated domain-containing protein [Flavobacteriaceae bacterium]HQU20372.1 heavy-metal-associated domain-containing protein [Flavobacteriaceae bacterium]HQU64264.1 heavy-metal-associated domain-containing protein [Flavobacteriaceae bacterium]HRW44275.1 heavy-metal-associated domain-containing protein [Flavobacteriaceae bacterium]
MRTTLIIMIVLWSGTLLAQDKNAKATVQVDGVCFMCKARIEKAAIKTKGVKTAVWSVDTHKLNLIYDARKTNLDTIQKRIAEVGHDTEKYKATDAAYESVSPCCKYRDPQIIESHN